ncbi:TPA: bacteriocin immunity protein [Pseudomonas aeruginosa]|uniref:bacteriocin immunity protein n=1 Tax=Pseudomonas aeruginosa TaxID=287 RepID=UPI000F82DA27|nr:bacteriocin immunity protein [Pseudomonas aeruginosa]RTW61734.1 bacteriocin immunity protein [Pseudomonas aeruginosa]
MDIKNNLADYTESEFLEIIEEFFKNKSGLKGNELEKRMDKLVKHFEEVTSHPRKSGVIFHPKPGFETPEGIVKEVKEWRAANGLPGFKAG